LGGLVEGDEQRLSVAMAARSFRMRLFASLTASADTMSAMNLRVARQATVASLRCIAPREASPDRCMSNVWGTLWGVWAGKEQI